MLTRDSIESIIRKRNRNSITLERNIQIVQSYFGLGNQKAPTLQSLGDEFGGMSRERIRRIIESTFTSKVTEEDKVTLYRIEKVISQYPFVWIEQLKGTLVEHGLTDFGLHDQGLLNLLRIFELCKDYEIYTSTFDVPTRYNFEHGESMFLACKEVKDQLHEVFSLIRSAPGNHGIACLEKVFKQEKLDERALLFYQTFLSNSINYWTYENKSGLWYVWEDRENVMFNLLGKISLVTRTVPVHILSDIVHRYIQRRSLPYGYPSHEIIEVYLKESVHTRFEGDEVELLIESTYLNKIEEDILRYYRERGETNISYTELRSFLQELGYDKPNYDKNLFQSPFLYVDRSEGRGNYRFILLNSFESRNLYDRTVDRLNKLDGTEFTSEVHLRKEQSILRDWVFQGKKTEHCAICGKLYSVRSLVCAHKKKRAYCTDVERKDPNIVMPLCKFGCDAMYEDHYFVVTNGEIVARTKDLTEVEVRYVMDYAGRKLDERWLEGKLSYFVQNYETEEL